LLAASEWNAALQTTGKNIKLKMNKEDIPQLSGWLVQQGVGILAIRPVHSLEDYFLSLTTPANYVDAPAN
jgi:hypothetical protein